MEKISTGRPKTLSGTSTSLTGLVEFLVIGLDESVDLTKIIIITIIKCMSKPCLYTFDVDYAFLV